MRQNTTEREQRRHNSEKVRALYSKDTFMVNGSSVFPAFNLKRMINIIDKNEFKKFLKELALIFSQKILGNLICMDLSPSNLNTQLFTSLFKAT